MENKINWNTIRKIFFVGIKGVGMMPLAIIAKEAGFEVAGSDLSEEFITDEVLQENEIEIFNGFDPVVIDNFFMDATPEESLLVTTGAHMGYKNPQVLRAQALTIPYLNQGQAVGVFMSGAPFQRDQQGITVTGSHGKTTISAMIATCLTVGGFDPSYTVGTSRIFPIGASGHFGKGKFFIAEGDEYVGEPVFDKTSKILYQKPYFAIINNIDFDHPDIYKDISDVKKVMTKFINQMQDKGVVFINSDDENLKDIKDEITSNVRIVTFGENDAEYQIQNITEGKGFVSFGVRKEDTQFDDFELLIPGNHNARNALSVIALLDQLSVPKEKIKELISSYKGSKRRMEVVGTTSEGAIVIDDYGHHPLEIKSTLSALKKFYERKIICVFQSHTYSRTRKLLEEFSKSFFDADELLLIPVFKSQRDTESDILSTEEFAAPFQQSHSSVKILDGTDSAAQYLKEKEYGEEYLILTIGAGEVYKTGYQLLKE